MATRSGEMLKEARGKKSRRAVAEDLGISVRALQSYELGDRIPSDPVKKKLADYYGLSVQYLFFS